MAPHIEPGIDMSGGPDIEKNAFLTPGGRLRIMVGAPASGEAGGASPPRLSTQHGIDLGPILQGDARPTVRAGNGGPSEIIYPHLEAGVYGILCPGRQVDTRIIEGKESMVDCTRP